MFGVAEAVEVASVDPDPVVNQPSNLAGGEAPWLKHRSIIEDPAARSPTRSRAEAIGPSDESGAR